MNSQSVSVTFSFLFLLALLVGPITGAETNSHPKVNCDLHHDPCTQSLSGCTITLDINPKPIKAMNELTFRVTLSGEKPETHLYIDLAMPGMVMGPNRVMLHRVSEDTYEGEGIIVRCPSGKRTWRATVTVPNMGAVEFIFDVLD